ncbi:MAG: hypothetical protein IT331_14435 [Anaerolineae bacterium]|nr:hypothetical protein [Anaerolineae bacterium]
MPAELPRRRVRADERAMYLIRVVGDVDVRWLDYFSDLSIAVVAIPDNVSISTLCTHNSDQAEIVGILNSLYQYGYPLISLQRIGDA